MWKVQNAPIKYTNDRHYQYSYIEESHCQYKFTKDQLVNQYPQLNSGLRKFEDIELDKKTTYTIKVENPYEVLFDEQLSIKIDNEFDVNNYDISNDNFVTKNKSHFDSVNLYKSKKYKKINNNTMYDFEDPPLIKKYKEVYYGDDSPKLLIVKNKKDNIINVYSNMHLIGTNINEIINSYSVQKQQYLNYELCNILGRIVLRPLKIMSLWWIHHKIDVLCKAFLHKMKLISGEILNIIKLINDSQLL